jgi:hypothetical protein
MDVFSRAFDSTIESASALTGAGMGQDYVAAVEEAIDRTVSRMNEIGDTNKNISYVKGDIFEPWQEGTFRIDAAARQAKGYDATALRDHSPVDLVIETPREYLAAQLKAYGTPEDTAKAISDPAYEGLIKVVPKDQLAEVREAAWKLYNINLHSRPEQAQQYLDTYNRATDALHTDKVHSRGVSEKELHQIAREIQKGKFDPAKHGLTPDNFIKASDIFRESSQAALNAAVLTAVLKFGPHLWKGIQSSLDGRPITIKDLVESGRDIGLSSFESGLRGGIAAGITASCKSGLLGEPFRSVNPNVVAAATVVAMNAVKNSLKVKNGEMSPAEFAEACLRDTFVVTFGVLGAGVGQSLIPVPILGALIGNFVGSVLAVVVYEGSKQVFLSFFIDTGISFFCIVKQDYEIPRNMLERSGCDLVTFDATKADTTEPDRVTADLVTREGMDIQLLRRGLIAVNVIGYVR